MDKAIIGKKIPDGKLRELVNLKDSNKLIKKFLRMFEEGKFEGVMIISVLNDDGTDISGNYVFLQCSIPDSEFLLDSIQRDVEKILNHLHTDYALTGAG